MAENQLLEIYKLHAQLASDMANQLTTTNRFYLTLIFGLLAFVFAILRGSGGLIPEEIDKKVILGIAAIIVGFFVVVVLARIWATSIGNYCEVLSKKYIVLLRLEEKLEFPFFKNEWGQTEDIPYVRLYNFGTWIPFFFVSVFFILALGSVVFIVLWF